MEVRTVLRKMATGVDFVTVSKAMNQSNVGSYIEENVAAFLRERGLEGVAHVFMATHSIGGRNWTVEEKREPAFFEEKSLNGGWYIFREEDVSYLECVSATSGSVLFAGKMAEGVWDLTLEVPVDENQVVYKGHYWKSFHEALGLPPDSSGSVA